LARENAVARGVFFSLLATKCGGKPTPVGGKKIFEAFFMVNVV
jgi:hypothetical protein